MNITLDQIYSRCEEVGDCWIWQGATSDTGYPIMKRHGGPCLLVRRVVMQLTDRPPAARQPVTAACEDKRCCSQVNNIKRGEAWKDYTNPFARLGARP